MQRIGVKHEFILRRVRNIEKLEYGLGRYLRKSSDLYSIPKSQLRMALKNDPEFYIAEKKLQDIFTMNIEKAISLAKEKI